MSTPAPPALPTGLTVRSGPSHTAPSMVRAAMHRPPSRKPEGGSPTLGYHVPAWQPKQADLESYRTLVGSRAPVPLAFPALIATSLHRDLTSESGFPAKALGIVHVASEIGSTAQLDPSRPWDVTAWLGDQRHVRGGLELDLWAVAHDGHSTWWTRVITLARSRSAAGEQASAASTVPELAAASSQTMEVAVPENIGRRYAGLSGDYNPFHLHELAAKPFGFKRAIAHGWWLTGRIPAILDADLVGPRGRYLTIVFRRPVTLPSTPVLTSVSNAEPQAAPGDRVEFALVRSDDPDKTLLGGRAGPLN